MHLRIGLKGINQQGSEMEKVYSYYCGILLLVVFALVSIPSGAVAKKLLDFGNNSCHTNTRSQEKIGGIPSDLLTSISLAETGRWN